MFRFTSIYVNMHSKLIHWGNWWNWHVWLHMEKFKGVSCAWQTLVDREANKYVGSYTSVIADQSPVISICCMLSPVVVTTEWGIWICGWILFVSFVRYGRDTTTTTFKLILGISYNFILKDTENESKVSDDNVISFIECNMLKNNHRQTGKNKWKVHDNFSIIPQGCIEGKAEQALL